MDPHPTPSWDDAMDAMGHPIFLHDQEYRILRANRAYLQEASATLEEVIGQPYWHVFPRGVGPLPGCQSAMAKVSAGKRTASETGCAETAEEFSVPDGRSFLSRSYVARDGLGAYRYSVHILEDITARRHLEQAHQAAEAKFQAITTAARDAIVLIDAEDRLVYCNPAFEKLLGYRAEELEGAPFHDRFVPERHRAAMQVGMRYFRESEGRLRVEQHTEVEAVHRDGHEIPLELTLAPVQIAGRWHAAGILRDISERRALEEERQRTLEDQRMFLAAVSHDLRTPLNAIHGFLDQLAHSELDPQQRQHVDLCRAGGQTMLGLIETVLELSRLEAGRVQLSEQDFDLCEFMNAQLGFLAPLAEQKGLYLEWSSSNDVPCRVRGDPVRLGQVLYNLVSNALRFTETGGIRVQVERTSFENELHFTVTDTGTGISKEDQPQIFEAFRQAGPALARKEGSGLGLKVCKELVNLMGGDISVESEPDRGTSFHFTVMMPPAASATPAQHTFQEAEVDTTSTPPGSGLRVLVAEDEPTNALLIQSLLTQAGCEEVTWVENGREAIENWEQSRPDLILLDLQMPEMDGREALRHIRAQEAEHALAHTPIALVTAHALEHFQQECFGIGCDAYLNKPIERKELWLFLARVQAEAA